ncbi:DNA binding protein [Microbacterium phage Dewdrop]|nr:DNA binding protein [Microbacterium phage Leaf]QGZ17373.1 DNA binding protein [Microbacterium phage Dewdrop]
MAKADDLVAQVVEAASEGVALSGAQKEATRRTEALQLRMAGLSYEAIGERLGISRQAASQMIQRALDHAELQGVHQLRAEENARLDRAQMAIWGDVLKGDLKAISAFLSISNARAKLNGLYAPTQVQMSMTIRQEMEDALSNLETLILHEAPAPKQSMQVLEGRVLDDDDD